MNERYSNREIDALFKTVMTTLAGFGETLTGVDKKIDWTNGKIARVQAWKEQVVGAGKVILIIVLPLMSWALYQISQIDTKIQEGVKSVLSTYENVEIRNQ